MSVLDHIDVALRRGRSPYTVADVLGWLTRGELSLAICDDMSASWREMPDGVVEVVHVGGRWSNEAMRWLTDRMKGELNGRSWRWRGRRGWARFLKAKGFEP